MPLSWLQSWKAGPEGQQRLKDFLIKALGLRFDEVTGPKLGVLGCPCSCVGLGRWAEVVAVVEGGGY